NEAFVFQRAAELSSAWSATGKAGPARAMTQVVTDQGICVARRKHRIGAKGACTAWISAPISLPPLPFPACAACGEREGAHWRNRLARRIYQAGLITVR